MKKIIGIVLSGLLLLGCLPVSVFAAAEFTPQTNAVDLRVGILGDTHVGSTSAAAYPFFQDNVNDLVALGENQLDGLVLSGDIIYQPASYDENNYDAVLGVLNQAGLLNKPFVWAMGNHEYPLLSKDETLLAKSRTLFTQKTGHALRQHVKMNGISFIAAAADDYYGKVSAETEAWLKDEIEASIAADSSNAVNGAFEEGVVPNSAKPVFLTLHHPVSHTIFDLDDTNYTQGFVDYLKSRPQVILLTGHMHMPAELPATMWQDGFSAFQVPHSSGGNLELPDMSNEIGPSDVHQGAMLEVKDNVVSIYKFNTVTNEFIGRPWVIDIPAIVADKTDSNAENDNDHYLYSPDKRENGNVPSFPADTAPSVEIKGCSVRVKWPHNAVPGTETPNQQDDFVRGYKVEICDSAGTVITSKIRQADFYYTESRVSNYEASFGLSYDTEYVVNVYPMSGLGLLGTPISKSIKTEADTVPAGATRYEVENYVGADNSDDVTVNVKASGGKLAGGTWTGSGNLTITVPITIEADGIYNLTYAMGEQTSSNVSAITVKLDGSTIGTNGSSYAQNISNLETYPWNYTPMRLYENKNCVLAAGNHTVTFEIAGVSASYNARKYFIDYFQVAFPEGQTLTANEPLTLELEDFSPNQSWVKDSKDASGGKIMSSSWTNADPDLYIPVKISDAGYYDVEYVVGKTTAPASYNQLNVAILDSNKTTTLHSLGNNRSGNDNTFTEKVYENSYDSMPMIRNKYSKLWLDEGLVYVNVDVLVFTYGDGSINHSKFNLDYFKFTPVADTRVTISSGAPTTFEFEKFIPIGGQTTFMEDSGASGGGYIYNGWISTATYNIPITVEQSGYFDIEYVLGKKKSNDHSAWTLKIGDWVIGSSSDSDTIDRGSYTTEAYAANPLSKFRENGVWLEKGNYILVFDVDKMNNGAGNHCTFVADYMKFTPKAMPKLNAKGALVVEYEDYAVSNSDVKDDAAASGGKFVTNGYSYSNQSAENKIMVEDAGYYTFEVVMGRTTAPQSYPLNYLMLDGETYLAYNNSYANAEDLSSQYTNYGNYSADVLGMWRFSYNQPIWLDKGVHIISTHLNSMGTPPVRRYNLDYFALTPAEGMTVSGSSVAVTGAYEQAVSGTAVLALYNGAKLVSFKTAEVSNTKAVTVATTEDRAFTVAKLFVLNSFRDMKPVGAVKVFEK